VFFEPWVIPLATLVIALSSFLYTQMTLRRTASADYVRSLEARVERLEQELADAERQLRDERARNVDLMRQVVRVTGGRRHFPGDDEQP